MTKYKCPGCSNGVEFDGGVEYTCPNSSCRVKVFRTDAKSDLKVENDG